MCPINPFLHDVVPQQHQDMDSVVTTVKLFGFQQLIIGKSTGCPNLK